MSAKKKNIGEAYDEIAERKRKRVLDILSDLLTIVGVISFLALCRLIVCWREAADSERRARDPQGAEARVERRMMEEDAAYRLCRRAAAVVFALPKEGAR